MYKPAYDTIFMQLTKSRASFPEILSGIIGLKYSLENFKRDTCSPIENSIQNAFLRIIIQKIDKISARFFTKLIIPWQTEKPETALS